MGEMILALDSSINKTGYCVMTGGDVVESGVIRTQGLTVGQKQASLCSGIKKLLGRKELAIKCAVVEIPAPIPYGRTQGRGGKVKNLGSLLTLSRAVGVITMTLHEWGIPVHEVTPQEWKGNTQKCWHQMVIQQRLGRRVTDDESDACMLALWYSKTRFGARHAGAE